MTNMTTPSAMLQMRAAQDLSANRAAHWASAALAADSGVLDRVLVKQISLGSQSDERVPHVVARDINRARELMQVTPGACLALATIWANASNSELKSAAINLFHAAQSDRVPLSRKQEMLYVHTLLDLSRVTEVAAALARSQRLTDDFQLAIHTDLVNPVISGSTSDARKWRKLFAELFKREGLAAPSVDLAARVPFDTLACHAKRDVDGPLVSVIMSTFKRGAEIRTSVQSVLNQSYSNFELLIVDDASGPEYETTLNELLDLDPRISVHRMTRNGGTYVARNYAIEQANGEFITTQDDDDWLHPLRLELQVEAITGSKGAVASRSEAVRAKPDMTFYWPGYERRRLGASSLMFRRELIEQIGYFDEVRKGADSEYTERIQEFAGNIVDVRKPLSITRLDQDSLSRSDFRFGWRHPDRDLYVGSYRAWHQQLKRKTTELERFPAPERGRLPFKAPASFGANRVEAAPTKSRFAVVIDLDKTSHAKALRDTLPVWLQHEFVVVVIRDPLSTGKANEQGMQLLNELQKFDVPVQTTAESIDVSTAFIYSPEALTYIDLSFLKRVSESIAIANWTPTSTTKITDHVGIEDRLNGSVGATISWFAPSEVLQEEWLEAGWHLSTVNQLIGVPLDR